MFQRRQGSPSIAVRPPVVRLVPLIATALVLLSGCVTPISPAPRVATAGLSPEQVVRAERNLRVFDTVWDIVNRRYYDPGFRGVDWNAAAMTYGPRATAAKDDQALHAAINRMLAPLKDVHTDTLNPEEAKGFRGRRRVITGIACLRLDGHWVVDEVMPGGAAEAAGVKRGWVVLSRDGQPLGERFHADYRDGQMVHWEFLDDNDRRIALALTARPVATPPRREVREVDGGVVYLRFDEFNHESGRWLRSELRSHRNAPAVVVDLRRNSGGGVFWLREDIGEFFDRPVGIGTFVSRGGSREEKDSWQFASAHYLGPLAVLVGSPTASAAEIFAAIMQEQHRAMVVGRKTAASVLAARQFRLPDGGMLEVSVEEYLTPGGRQLEGNGVAPEVAVPPPTLADVRTGRDADLEAALRSLAGR